jgi:hypothetical protein
VFDCRLNLASDTQYTDQKGFAEDLSEGKFSFPVVHGIRVKPDSNYIPSMTTTDLGPVELAEFLQVFFSRSLRIRC